MCTTCELGGWEKGTCFWSEEQKEQEAEAVAAACAETEAQALVRETEAQALVREVGRACSGAFDAQLAVRYAENRGGRLLHNTHGDESDPDTYAMRDGSFFYVWPDSCYHK